MFKINMEPAAAIVKVFFERVQNRKVTGLGVESSHRVIEVDAVSQVQSLVYDLLVRVVPGGYCFVILARAYGTDLSTLMTATLGSSKAVTESAPALLIFMVAASYVIGLLVALLSDGLHRLVFLIIGRRANLLRQIATNPDAHPASVREAVLKCLTAESVKNANDASGDVLHRIIVLWYDRLRAGSVEQYNRLTRLRAEYRMYSGLAVTSWLGAAARILALMTHRASDAGLFAASLFAIGALFTWGFVRAHSRFEISIVNHYCLTAAMNES